MTGTRCLMFALAVVPASRADAQAVAPVPPGAIHQMDLDRLSTARVMAGAALARAGRALSVSRAQMMSAADLAASRIALAQIPGGRVAPLARLDEGFTRSHSTPPEAWAQQDPGDKLYRDAKAAFSQASYARAAELYAQIYARYPHSAYAPDAYYWQAYALSRRGGDSSLRKALEVLALQRSKAPKAATRDEAEELRVRIQGLLARGGDAEAAAAIASAAAVAGTPPAPPAIATVPAMPNPPRGGITSVPPVAAIAGRAPRSGQGRRDECESDDDVQSAALNALLQMDEARATPILKKVLARRDAESLCLRRKAVFLVSQHEGKETEEILLNAARTDPDVEVRGQAVFWLSQVDSPGAVTALDSILRSAADPALQEKALFAVSQHDSPRARQILRDFAMRPGVSDDLREKAIFWIGQGDDPERLGYLKGIYGQLKTESLREKVLFSMSQIDGPESAKWLLDVAGDQGESIELRKKALFWAGQHGGSSPELLALYEKMPNREMREQLIFVYSQMDRKPAVDKLISIAKTEPDRELRKKAIFWLSQMDDPRVAEFLASLLEKP